MFTYYLQFHRTFLPLLPILGEQQHEFRSDGVSLTKIASSPMHSILHQGIMNSSFFEKKLNPALSRTIRVSILASSRSISKSQGYPSLSPPHRLITSSSRISALLTLFIYCIHLLKDQGCRKHDSLSINVYATYQILFRLLLIK